MKFKVGDKVRRISNPCGDMETGEIDTIIGIEKIIDDYCVFRLKNHKSPHNCEYYFCSNNFEKVEENIIEYRGKKYKVIAEHSDTLLIKEYKEEILTKKEKEYLNAIIKPFKKYVINISKIKCLKNNEIIVILYKDYEIGKRTMSLPSFKKCTMYKNMEIDRFYTLEELGLGG